jgi:dTDP-4-amino-4,6-dideoxygalactose transaminase
MSGWSKQKDVLDLSDEVIAKFDAAPPSVRKHAWYWVSLHMEVEYELSENALQASLDDEIIEWLRTHPERYNRHKEVKALLVSSLEKQLENAKKQLERLG